MMIIEIIITSNEFVCVCVCVYDGHSGGMEAKGGGGVERVLSAVAGFLID